MGYWEFRENLDYWLDDKKVLVVGVFTGLLSLFRKSCWKWMKETKEEQDMTWFEVIGVILYNDYRLKKHWENSPDW